MQVWGDSATSPQGFLKRPEGTAELEDTVSTTQHLHLQQPSWTLRYKAEQPRMREKEDERTQVLENRTMRSNRDSGYKFGGFFYV